MAKAADQFRSSDLSLWGIIALVTWAVAILLANVSALVPSGVFAALHASRMDTATTAQLRAQVAVLQEEQTRMRRENNALLQRFDLAERSNSEAAKRIGALEVSLPKLAERGSVTELDTSVTASIGDKTAETFEVEGGTVSVTQKPLVPLITARPEPAVEPLQLELPALPVADASAFGLALGEPVASDPQAAWDQLGEKIGTLLIGLSPLLQPATGAAGHRIVAGPLPSLTQAQDLCDRLDRVGIVCEAVTFTGEPLTENH